MSPKRRSWPKEGTTDGTAFSCGCEQGLPTDMPRRKGGMPPRIARGRHDVTGTSCGIGQTGERGEVGTPGSSTTGCGKGRPLPPDDCWYPFPSFLGCPPVEGDRDDDQLYPGPRMIGFSQVRDAERGVSAALARGPLSGILGLAESHCIYLLLAFERRIRSVVQARRFPAKRLLPPCL